MQHEYEEIDLGELILQMYPTRFKHAEICYTIIAFSQIMNIYLFQNVKQAEKNCNGCLVQFEILKELG